MKRLRRVEPLLFLLASLITACGSSIPDSTDGASDAAAIQDGASSVDVAVANPGDMGVVDAVAARDSMISRDLATSPPDGATASPDLTPLMVDSGGVLPACADGGLPQITQFSAGGTNTCAVRSDGTLWCWGLNSDGQVGDGTTIMRTLPVQVTTLGNQVATVAVGENRHACALLKDGTVKCWGSNTSGSLGDGTNMPRPTPVAVVGLTNVAEVLAGSDFNCARKLDGSLVCWGDNSERQLGDGTMMNRSLPVPVTPVGTSVAQVDVGWFHACVRKTNGSVWCWGRNSYGMLGDGTFMSSAVPVQVVGLAGVTDLSAGPYHSCARKMDGTLWCWGSNRAGELNDGTIMDRSSPVQITALGTNVLEADEGFPYTCARKTDQTVWCWGWDMPTGLTQTGGLGPADAIAAGDDHTCARRTNGTLWCWGFNSSGQLGDGTTTGRATPAPVHFPCP